MIRNDLIGGEFAIDPNALRKDVINGIDVSYSLGRTCLYAILNDVVNEIDELLLPDYMCKSIADVPLRLGMPFGHYIIDKSLLPDMDSIRRRLEGATTPKAIVLISYFGLINLDDVIADLRSNYPTLIIIVDDVQNYYGFGHHLDFDYCFTSYRKWFSVPDGAKVLKKDNNHSLLVFSEEPRYVSYKVAGNLLKNHKDLVQDYVPLELLNQGENLMDVEYKNRCSAIGKELFSRIDTDKVKESRKRNAKLLHEGLNQLGIEHLYSEYAVPLFIPIFINERDRLRECLFSSNIFAPVHWPLVDSELQGNSTLYDNELSLICDQRYDEADMERVLREIKNGL